MFVSQRLEGVVERKPHRHGDKKKHKSHRKDKKHKKRDVKEEEEGTKVEEDSKKEKKKKDKKDKKDKKKKDKKKKKKKDRKKRDKDGDKEDLNIMGLDGQQQAEAQSQLVNLGADGLTWPTSFQNTQQQQQHHREEDEDRLRARTWESQYASRYEGRRTTASRDN